MHKDVHHQQANSGVLWFLVIFLPLVDLFKKKKSICFNYKERKKERLA